LPNIDPMPSTILCARTLRKEENPRATDIIVSIDGRMTKRIGLEETRRLFRQNNTRYKLMLDRGGETVRATILTRDLFGTSD
jgi:hypothetical protein